MKQNQTLRVDESGEFGGDLTGYSGSSSSDWLRGTEVESLSSAIFGLTGDFEGTETEKNN